MTITNLTAVLNERVEAMLANLAGLASDDRISYQVLPGVHRSAPDDPGMPYFQVLLILPTPIIGTLIHNLSPAMAGPTVIPDAQLEAVLRAQLESLWQERDRLLAEGA